MAMFKSFVRIAWRRGLLDPQARAKSWLDLPQERRRCIVDALDQMLNEHIIEIGGGREKDKTASSRESAPPDDDCESVDSTS